MGSTHRPSGGNACITQTRPRSSYRIRGGVVSRRLVIKQDEPATMPHEDLRAITSLADEAEQIAAEWIEPPRANDREEPVVSAPHIDRFRRDVDAHRHR